MFTFYLESIDLGQKVLEYAKKAIFLTKNVPLAEFELSFKTITIWKK